MVRVELPAQLVELLFEQCRIDRQFLRPSEKSKIISPNRKRLNLATRRAEVRSINRSPAAQANRADDCLRLGFRHTHANSLAAGVWSSNQLRSANCEAERTAAGRGS